MVSKQIDLRIPCPTSLLDGATIDTNPKIDKSIVLLIDLSAQPYYYCQTLIVTAQGQLLLSSQTTAELFTKLEHYHGMTYQQSILFSTWHDPKKRLWPYCVNQCLYYPITHKASHHRHWIAFHSMTHYLRNGHTLHLYYGKDIEIILPDDARTILKRFKLYRSIIEQQTHHWQDIQHFHTRSCLQPCPLMLDDDCYDTQIIPHLLSLIATRILEDIDKTAPEVLDKKTKEQVLSHYLPPHRSQRL